MEDKVSLRPVAFREVHYEIVYEKMTFMVLKVVDDP